METNSLFIVTVAVVTVFILFILINVTYDRRTYFNANRFKVGSKSEIVPIRFDVIKIEESETQYKESCLSKKLWKYTVVNHFFFEEDKKFIHEKYVFWDEPEKYKVGDVLTLSNIK
ncbi:hypothetical protein J6O48_13840 [bacterium]|nr:hypothetical protein [bacterium]